MKQCDGCTAETCQDLDIKFYYDKQIEKFDRKKQYSSPDELKEFISERKNFFLSSLDEISPNINDNQKAYCLKICLTWLLDFYKVEEEKLKKPTGKVIQSLFWTGNNEQLQKLHVGLIQNGFIDPMTNYEAFSAIFSDELSQCATIKWRASNKLLSYLFNQMYASHLIVKEWQSVIENFKLFQNKSDKLLTANDLGTALSSINDPYNCLNPRGSKEIDSILKTLRDLKT
jgi:hypothetical protein